MFREHYPLWLGGEPVETGERLPVHDKADGRRLTEVSRGSGETLSRAVEAAHGAAPAMAALPAFRRRDVLTHVVGRLGERAEELAHVVALEAGKPIAAARGEVERAVDTFTVAAEEATRIGGEHLGLDVSPRGEGLRGITRRVPVGACAFITPFNFPLNLVAHKVAPALAAGCPFVLKPASTTPVSALLLGEILAETDLPPGAFSIVPASGSDAGVLVEDGRVRLLSFTGSAAVGWDLEARAGRKKVVLELGGNAACLLDRDTDLDVAVPKLLAGAYGMSGQSCISVQRILAHRELYEPLRERLVDGCRGLRAGPLLDPDTVLGPLVDEDAARRVQAWVEAAVARGARVLAGGPRRGSFVPATLLEDVPRDADVSCREVFGPVATLASFDDWEQGLALANDSDYGLQAGVFTRDLRHAWRAFEALEVGAVVVGDVPTLRVDAMPYGGVKQSGFGREGVRWAIEALTELRLLVLRG